MRNLHTYPSCERSQPGGVRRNVAERLQGNVLLVVVAGSCPPCCRPRDERLVRRPETRILIDVD